MPYAPLRRRRRPLREYWQAPPKSRSRSRSRPRRKAPEPSSPTGLVHKTPEPSCPHFQSSFPFNYLFDMYTSCRYNVVMIKTFADKETEKIYNQQFSRKLPQSIQRIALRKLMMLDNAERIEDLRVPPANHLELLHGNRAGQYSIRINQQYRICFIFENGVSRNVEIVDYHS